MNAIDLFADLLKHRIAPFLMERGFRGSRQLFIGQFGQNWGMVQFQKSAYGTKDAVRFTIILRIPKSTAVCGSRPNRLCDFSVYCFLLLCSNRMYCGQNHLRLRVSISERLSLVTFFCPKRK